MGYILPLVAIIPGKMHVDCGASSDKANGKPPNLNGFGYRCFGPSAFLYQAINDRHFSIPDSDMDARTIDSRRIRYRKEA